MIISIQNVINSIPNVTQEISKKFSLSISLFLRTSERKTFSSLARCNNLSYRSVYVTNDDALNYIKYSKNYLVSLIKNFSKYGKGKLLIDFTGISKPFSQNISDVTYDYSGTTKRVEKCISVGFCVWTNGKICIPFDFENWLRKKDAVDTYKTKIELAKELIISAQKEIAFNEVILDGAFASQEMIQFLSENNFYFTMRIPRNRVIVIGKNAYQLQQCPKFRLKRNRKFKVIYASYKGFHCYFTAHKRKTKNGNFDVVFIISNVRKTARKHVITYRKRWPQEKFHRTAKQKLGLADCQSTSRYKQHAHIFMVMMAYTKLELMKIYKKKKSPEEIIKLFRHQKSPKDYRDLRNLEETFMV